MRLKHSLENRGVPRHYFQDSWIHKLVTYRCSASRNGWALLMIHSDATSTTSQSLTKAFASRIGLLNNYVRMSCKVPF
jgi:hypothetical protein